jgi:uncharacterized membrane protein
MDVRFALHELSARYKLAPEARARLAALAPPDTEPQNLIRTVAFGLALLGALLGGLGIIFWIAANWESLTRFGRFALLQALIVVMCAGTALRPAARLPLAVVALMATGGLFGFFGQTYQTGADPWQLFALWAALTLPLCLGVRHDALWTAWVVVAMTGIALALESLGGNVQDLPVILPGWGLASLLTFSLSGAWRRRTGAGAWSLRTALALTAILVTACSLQALFARPLAPAYALGVIILAAAATAFASARHFDTFALSAIGLGLNVLLVGGLARLLLEGSHGDALFPLLILGLTAAGLLAATVNLILRLARQQGQGDTA